MTCPHSGSRPPPSPMFVLRPLRNFTEAVPCPSQRHVVFLFLAFHYFYFRTSWCAVFPISSQPPSPPPSCAYDSLFYSLRVQFPSPARGGSFPESTLTFMLVPFFYSLFQSFSPSRPGFQDLAFKQSIGFFVFPFLFLISISAVINSRI